jgi:hypothetical protein
MGETAQLCMQFRERKCSLRYAAKAELEGYSVQSSTDCNNTISAKKEEIREAGSLHLK